MKKALYVHIPFCNHMCAYCGFAKTIYNQDLVDKYLKVLDFELKSKDLNNLETIYIGGGTPSSLNKNQLEVLLKMLKPYTNDVVEYTIEINPDSMTYKKAKIMAKYGINRSSVGMQVTQDHLIKLIERKHNFEDMKNTIKILHSVNISNISVDLMYGIPTQTLEDFKESIDLLCELDITHISLYALTIEDNTKFERLNYKEIDADLDADMYEMAISNLEKCNFNLYEISNFAKANYESVHNKYYWKYKDFIGVGLSASGKENHYRYTNTKSFRKYLDYDFDQEIIKLSLADEIFEYVMMNLRLTEGFLLADFFKRFNVSFLNYYQSQVEKLVAEKLLIIKDGIVKASFYGREILFTVIEQFMD